MNSSHIGGPPAMSTRERATNSSVAGRCSISQALSWTRPGPAARPEHHTRRVDPRAVRGDRRVPRADGGTFPWYSSFGSDFNYDFHAAVDGPGRPPMVYFRTEDELAEAGTLHGEHAWRISRDQPLPPRRRQVYHTYSTFGRGIEEFHNGHNYLDLTALGRQEVWEEPKGRAVPLGLQVGGPNMHLPDEYEA
jgi:hypothetical protein